MSRASGASGKKPEVAARDGTHPRPSGPWITALGLGVAITLTAASIPLGPAKVLGLTLAVAAAAVLFRAPEPAFLILVFFLPYLRVFVFQVGFILTISEIMVVVTFIALTIEAFSGKRRLEFPALGYLFIVFAAIALLSALNALRDVPLPQTSDLRFAEGRNAPQSRSLTTVVLIAGALMAGFVTFNVLTDERKVGRALLAHLLSATLVSAYGLWQILGYMAGFDTGLKFTEVVTGSFPRISPTTPEPLYFANYLSTVIPFSLAFFLVGRREGVPHGLFGVAIALGLAVQTAAFLFSFSTGGLIAGAAGTVVVVILTRRLDPWACRRFAVFLLVSVLLMALTSALFGIPLASSLAQALHKVVESDNLSNRERADARLTALAMFREHPLLGVGVGNYGFLHNAYRPPDSRYVNFLTVSNNFYLELLAETGLIGFLSFAAAAVALIARVRRAVLHGKNAYVKTVAAGLSGALVAVAIQLSTFSAAYLTHIWVMVGLAALLGEKLARPQPKGLPAETRPWPRKGEERGANASRG